MKLTLGDRLAVVGNRKYTQIFVTRVYVNALLLSLPSSKKRMNEQERSRFFYTSNVILVDAGNSCDFHQYVNFAGQYYRRDVISRVLNSIIITRVFIIYQLANILINELPRVIQHYDAKMIVVSDLLNMFVRDPQIEANKATYLINEIVNSITKSRALEDVLVIMSLPFVDSAYNHNDKPAILYNKTIIPRFDKCIEIMNGKDNENRNKMIDIKIRNNSRSDFHNDNLISINKRDLTTVSAPAE